MEVAERGAGQKFVQIMLAVVLLSVIGIRVEADELRELMGKARAHAYEVQMAGMERGIRGQERRIERSEYYPRINLYVGSEYTHNMREGRMGAVTTVGEMFINPYTRYQTLLGITMSYNVYDFGVRRGRMEMAKRSEEIGEIAEREGLRAVYVKVIEKYSGIVLLKREIEIKEGIVEQIERKLAMKRRLNGAGEISSIEIKEEEIELAGERKELLEMEERMEGECEELSYYIGERYEVGRLSDEEMRAEREKEIEVGEEDYERSEVNQIYGKEIARKEAEIAVLRRSRYPKLVAYGRYYMYGSDRNNYGGSLGDIGLSNYTIGGSLSMPIFDGMRNREEIRKAEMEKRRLEIEREKAVEEYRRRVEGLVRELRYERERIAQSEEQMKRIEERKKMKERLREKSEIDGIAIVEEEIARLERARELIREEVSEYAIRKTLEIMLTPALEV